MLGSLKSKQRWQWAAYGKQPASRDFLRLGSEFPLMKNFSDWVEKGYTMLPSEKKAAHKACSWRFWVKGPHKESLVCGLVRDSNDRLGRPYPLLIMGTGTLKGWEDQWDLLPFACDETWNLIEYISVQMYNDLKKLEAEVQNIRAPYPEWTEFAGKRKGELETMTASDTASSQVIKDFENEALLASKKTECILCLDNKLFHNQTAAINYCLFLFKPRIEVPNAVFMGGTMEKTYLVLFRRPLTPSDFTKLWSMGF